MSEYDWRLSVMPPHDTIAQITTIWKACEDAGLDVVGPADSQNLMREMVVSLTVAAMSTSKIKLMTYATNPVTRHPTVTAGAFVALEELAPGRLMMGIATGDSALWSDGPQAGADRRLARLSDRREGAVRRRGDRLGRAPLPAALGSLRAVRPAHLCDVLGPEGPAHGRRGRPTAPSSIWASPSRTSTRSTRSSPRGGGRPAGIRTGSTCGGTPRWCSTRATRPRRRAISAGCRNG